MSYGIVYRYIYHILYIGTNEAPILYDFAEREQSETKQFKGELSFTCSSNRHMNNILNIYNMLYIKLKSGKLKRQKNH